MLAAAASVALAGAQPYTLADLEKLVADKAYQEAFVHLGDVAPAQRTAKWIDVAATASAGLLASLPADATVLALIDGIDREYPQLLKSAKYLTVRNDVALAGFASCADGCVQIAAQIVGRTTDRKLVFEVGKLIVTHSPIAAVAMFKRVLDKTACADAAVERAMLAGLARSPDTVVAIDARAIMATCWNDVKAGVLKEFDAAGKRSAFHKNTCDMLHARRLLSSLQAKRCGK